jgi:hypothetical protein
MAVWRSRDAGAQWPLVEGLLQERTFVCGRRACWRWMRRNGGRLRRHNNWPGIGAQTKLESATGRLPVYSVTCAAVTE